MIPVLPATDHRPPGTITVIPGPAQGSCHGRCRGTAEYLTQCPAGCPCGQRKPRRVCYGHAQIYAARHAGGIDTVPTI